MNFYNLGAGCFHETESKRNNKVLIGEMIVDPRFLAIGLCGGLCMPLFDSEGPCS